jgi:hypothetical protein
MYKVFRFKTSIEVNVEQYRTLLFLEFNMGNFTHTKNHRFYIALHFLSLCVVELQI